MYSPNRIRFCLIDDYFLYWHGVPMFEFIVKKRGEVRGLKCEMKLKCRHQINHRHVRDKDYFTDHFAGLMFASFAILACNFFHQYQRPPPKPTTYTPKRNLLHLRNNRTDIKKDLEFNLSWENGYPSRKH